MIDVYKRQALKSKFDFSTVKEFTVEAGRADSITREKLEVLYRHRVSRISVNPQTMKQDVYKRQALDISYNYDVRGQLLEERRNGASVCYAYDKAGNRIRKTDVQGEIRYLYNAKNQLIAEESPADRKQFSYDRQGGIIEEKNAAGILSLIHIFSGEDAFWSGMPSETKALRNMKPTGHTPAVSLRRRGRRLPTATIP